MVIWMFDNPGDISDLFGTISVVAMPVTKANAIIGSFHDPGDAVGCSKDPVGLDQRSTAKEIVVIVPVIQTDLPRP